MPRSFDLSADFFGTVEQVHSAFSDEKYWLARLADSGADSASLESMTVDDGSVAVATTQSLRTGRLPAMITQFHPRDLEIVRHETWTPIRDGVARAEVTGAVPGAPVSLTGTATLAPLRSALRASGPPQAGGPTACEGSAPTSTGTGSRLTFRATVEVNIPLVGGKLESFIGGKLAELVAAEQRFTTLWITENA